MASGDLRVPSRLRCNKTDFCQVVVMGGAKGRKYLPDASGLQYREEIHVAPVDILVFEMMEWEGTECQKHTDPDRSDKVDLSTMSLLLDYVDVTDARFVAAVLSIAFNPLFWNLEMIKPLEMTSVSFMEAMKSQPKLEILDCALGYYAALTLIAIGSLFVISSFLALGFTGTFLGDYFGILMEAKVTCFPFSVLDNPMYWGSSIIYLGWSIMYASPAGLILTVAVMLCYTIALQYEGPFTEEIYRRKGKQE